MQSTSRPKSVLTKLQRVAEISGKATDMVWTTLAHNIDIILLKEAYRLTRKNGAVGVDRQTAKDYEENLEENLQSLLVRCKSGTYKAPPVRRTYVPKGNGKKMRPIGIPTFEDKVLQRAVAMVLNAVYEQDFLECSYGFRPGRSAHQAIDRLWKMTMKTGVSVVLELDIEKCFDVLDHGHMRSFLDQRVRDGVIRKAIDKWLKAGVMEEGVVSHPETGTPQGGVISPILMNIYLHEVLDNWFEKVVKPRLAGKASLIRYADDATFVFHSKADADKVMEVLPKRFGRFGLNLHPEKTRLIDFKQPKPDDKKVQVGCFDFLGFTHYWGRSRKGNWIVKRKTAKDRFARALKSIDIWCRWNRHLPMSDQHVMLSMKLRGHSQYYYIRGNSCSISRYYHEVCGIWRKWLNRRSQRARMTWERFMQLRKIYPFIMPKMTNA
jgi:group II intron reverse transcriptase/maturase